MICKNLIVLQNQSVLHILAHKVIYQNKYTNSGSQAQDKNWKFLIL